MTRNSKFEIRNSKFEMATYVACLTPPGRGAIATLAVRGPRAWELARQLFRPATSAPLPEQPEPRRFWYGRLGKEIVDEVVLSVERGGDEPWIEVHCHGGPEAVRLLTETCAAHGAQPCSWQELARIHAEPGTRSRAEAELVHASTVRTAAILLDQVQGGLDRALFAVRAALDQGNQVQAASLLEELVRYIPVGKHLTRPWRVAVLGPPNVGKSSLVNALAGFQRSIVDPTPGTTRDVVTTLIAVDGWPVELADTAGLRDEASGLEEAGIERALHTATEADLCLWVLDASAPLIWPPAETRISNFVLNKIDLQDTPLTAGGVALAAVSARTGQGLEDLCASLSRWLVPTPPPPGAAVPFTPTLCEQVLTLHDFIANNQLGEALRCWETIWQD